MPFGADYLPTYVPALDGPVAGFYGRLFEQTEALDALGFDDIWVTEHHFDEYGGMIPDPAAFLAAAACRTSRIHLGIAVVVLPLRNPLQLAESYEMVDVISGGPLPFGIGRGSAPAEFEGFGIAHEGTADGFQEAAEVIRQAWPGEPVTFHGESYHYLGVRALPQPRQRPYPPVWVSASRSVDVIRFWRDNLGLTMVSGTFHLGGLPPDLALKNIRLFAEQMMPAFEPAASSAR